MQDNFLSTLETNTSYNRKDKNLWIGKDNFFPENCEVGDIGNCVNCDFVMEPLSFHKLSSDYYAIVAQCSSCKRLILSVYDMDWKWCKEIDLATTEKVPETVAEDVSLDKLSGIQLLESIPEKVLNTVFSPREIEAMYSRAKGEKYVRQYLYNARKKYDRFADIFGIRINI